MEILLAKVTGVSESIAVSTGSAAIDLVVEALEIKPGDHCIVPNFTIISTVANLLRKGAKVHLIDADPETWSIDANATADAIKAKTKLVLPVHIYGLPADMDPILKAARNYNAFVLEDAAEALGVNYKGKPCGSLGDAAVFSFYANKIVTGGEGGAITTNNEELATKLRSLRSLAHTSERFIHQELGWNSRISGLSAALVKSQLKRLESLVIKKKSIAHRYRTGLNEHPWLTFMPNQVSYSSNAFWVFPILLNSGTPFDAKQFQLKLRENGTETRRFFCPIHLQPLISKFNVELKSDYKISNQLWNRGLYLPSGLGNTVEEIDKVIVLIWRLAK
jgi:perosamine synthetase